MTDFENKVMNDLKVEAVSKAIINETSKWDFGYADYISLVNALLELPLNKPPQSSGSLGISEEKQERHKLTFPLSGEQINIRLFNPNTDFEIVQNWLEDEFGRFFLLTRSSGSEQTLTKLLNNKENILGLISLDDYTPIGLMGYLAYDEYNHKAEMRKLIGEEALREKGYAKEAALLWIKYGINNLNLKKIYLHTIENNIRNVTLNKELGFQIEGILRNECRIDNKYYDLLRMSLIVD